MNTSFTNRLTIYNISIILFLLFPFTSQAQSLFGALETDRIPTGFLLDQAAEVASVASFDGTELSDSNYVSVLTHSFFMETMRTADVRGRSWRDEYGSALNDNTIPILISLYKYNRIRADALTDGSLTLENDILYDVFDQDGTWRNPYEEHIFFAISPASHAVKTSNVTFVPEFSDNINLSYTSLEIDPGDGLGYRSFPQGGRSVIYTTEGIKEIKVKLTMQQGVTLYSHSLLEYSTPPVITPQPNIAHPTINRLTIQRQASDGTIISAGLAISYADSTNQTIQNPFIYVEGFDPVGLGKLLNIKDDYGFTDIISYTDTTINSSSVYSKVRDVFPLHDIIYVNWNNSEADIRDNAELLIDILQFVNYMKHSAGSTNRNIILGESMGGLIVRYALRKMELENRVHECQAYISNDAPHKGVHVPLGALYALNGVLNVIYTSSLQNFKFIKLITANLVAELRKYQLSASAQQMLCNYVTVNNTLDHSKFDEFQSILNTMGLPRGDDGFPMDNIAFSNGGSISLDNALVGNEYYLKLLVAASPSVGALALAPLIDVIAGALGMPSYAFMEAMRGSITASLSFLNIEFFIRPDTGTSQNLCDFSFTYTKIIPFLLFPIPIITPYSFSYSEPGNIRRLDYYEGSVYNLNAQLDQGLRVLLSMALGGYVEFATAQKFMFVPSASSLASSGWSESTSTQNYALSTPFDAYALERPSTEAQSHTALKNKLPLARSQISAGQILGPSHCTDTTALFTLSGAYPPGATWSTSNSGVATISQDGVLTAHHNGTVKVILSTGAGRTRIKKQKTVFVEAFPSYNGIPPITLQVGEDAQGVYVEAVSTDPNFDLNDIAHDPWYGFYCQWYVKVDFEGMDFISKYASTSDNLFRCYLGDRPNEAQDKILVSLRISRDGYTTPLYSIIIPYYKEFSLAQPLLIFLRPGQSITYFNGNSLQVLMPHTPLVVQSDQEEIRAYIRNRAYAVLMVNGHDYPNVSEENDKLCFNVFLDPFITSLFVNPPSPQSGEWPYPLTVQIRTLVYEDELLKEYVIPIILAH